ncbi:Acyl-CoA Delta(11) desaturase, partial [Tetrabaena socialis]
LPHATGSPPRPPTRAELRRAALQANPSASPSKAAAAAAAELAASSIPAALKTDTPFFARVLGGAPHHIINIASFTLPFILPWLGGAPSRLQLALTVPIALLLIGVPMSVCLHRFFSHGAFQTSRPFQFLLGVVACMAYQNGPIWWASKHNRHHRYCDTAADPHSWLETGFWYSWVGWTLGRKEIPVDTTFVPMQFRKAPELWLLDSFWCVPVLAANLLVWHLAGYEAMIYCLYIPMMLCRLITLGFNVGFHPMHKRAKEEDAKCKSTDITRGFAGTLAQCASHRPGFDLPWHLTIRWWAAVGLVWNCA